MKEKTEKGEKHEGGKGGRIWVPEDVKTWLDSLKVHKRQAYHEIIVDVVKTLDLCTVLKEIEMAECDQEMVTASWIIGGFIEPLKKRLVVLHEYYSGGMTLETLVKQVGEEKIPEWILSHLRSHVPFDKLPFTEADYGIGDKKKDGERKKLEELLK